MNKKNLIYIHTFFLHKSNSRNEIARKQSNSIKSIPIIIYLKIFIYSDFEWINMNIHTNTYMLYPYLIQVYYISLKDSKISRIFLDEDFFSIFY